MMLHNAVPRFFPELVQHRARLLKPILWRIHCLNREFSKVVPSISGSVAARLLGSGSNSSPVAPPLPPVSEAIWVANST